MELATGLAGAIIGALVTQIGSWALARRTNRATRLREHLAKDVQPTMFLGDRLHRQIVTNRDPANERDRTALAEHAGNVAMAVLFLDRRDGRALKEHCTRPHRTALDLQYENDLSLRIVLIRQLMNEIAVYNGMLTERAHAAVWK